MNREPKIMYVKVSENCNSHCFMCHYAGKTNSYNITQEQYKKLLNTMKQYSYKVIRFTGGEPLLHKELCTFIKQAKDINLFTSIITNGFLLKINAEKLITSGLDQCIISLDGSNSEIHDNLRNFKGCFNKIIEGIKELRKYNPNINIRINTVVSGKNIHDLCNIYKLLETLEVNQWSIIPVKYKENTWNEKSIEYYNEFKKIIPKNSKIEFLGNSRNWAGKTDKEICHTFNNGKCLNSENPCTVVDYVRFYIPDIDRIVPCNCISHRLNQLPFDLDGDAESCCEKIKNWLKVNSKDCTGCEPLNIFINDNPEIMEDDNIRY